MNMKKLVALSLISVSLSTTACMRKKTEDSKQSGIGEIIADPIKAMGAGAFLGIVIATSTGVVDLQLTKNEAAGVQSLTEASYTEEVQDNELGYYIKDHTISLRNWRGKEVGSIFLKNPKIEIEENVFIQDPSLQVLSKYTRRVDWKNPEGKVVKSYIMTGKGVNGNPVEWKSKDTKSFMIQELDLLTSETEFIASVAAPQNGKGALFLNSSGRQHMDLFFNAASGLLVGGAIGVLASLTFGVSFDDDDY